MAQDPHIVASSSDGDQPAVELIRQKVSQLYTAEPNAQTESQESEAVARRSKHQQFMHELNTSGKDLATIQTEWHRYYQALPDAEKRVVWEEFYQSQSLVTGAQPTTPQPVVSQTFAAHKNQVLREPAHRTRPAVSRKPHNKLRDARTTAEIQAALRDKVTANGSLTVKHHIQSLLFGLGMGSLVIIVFLFSFFNEIIIAPFIQPSRVQAATPIIVSSNSVAPTTSPEVIIPKINVQIPVNYSETSTNENDIENDLEDGVVHYPTTVMPGETGNAAFFGHSSNNIFNKGKYKFAFVLLHTLVNGDTFYLTYNSKVYVYKVISHTIVSPNDVGVLGPVSGQTATATLITCDPPGTSINRLVVVGQQISPDPSGNTAPVSTTASTTSKISVLPGNGPTLLTRILRTTLGKFASFAIVAVLVVSSARWLHRRLAQGVVAR